MYSAYPPEPQKSLNLIMDTPTTSALIEDYLLYFILPLWLAAGFADYLLHRHTKIEDTSGMKESLIHWLQLTEAGVAVIAGLLFQINSLVILIMLLSLVAHEISSLWDSSFAIGRRYIGALEQHVHSFLDLLPVMAVSFVTILHWDQFLALLGLADEPARFELRLKQDALPLTYIVSLVTAIIIFNIVPYGEELWRCVRQRR